MKKIEKVGIIIEKTRTGFSAYATDIPIYTTGKNIAELIGNANEATQLYLQNLLFNIKSILNNSFNIIEF